ncbi:hypothetical protein CCR94_20975 [Rhodoblastus sphagnicola]|uniref:Glycosyltransferase RgtA/B/C/D-like domain-containing protein n=1 Tax=Rhodoblastus sphagnicola TaxID=333368 RepID=A0A2S6MX16_9HYPH|nr:hypothetical protein [Rhodoblastus sphagnicola]MBB4199228.1 hypothetical protein [Rhodoblastus sphagnicola]PPQ26901.1 hypothetical protein CCR94_20975 [Rhodoblastus sphagnicola]
MSFSVSSTPARAAAPPDNLVFALFVLGALVLSLVFQQGRLLDVWSGGGFYDTDDAMRMVQVRDLLAGQGWYDLTQYRLNPPQGSILHWSRIVDIPLVILLKFFGLFLTPDLAERAARIVFPTLVLAVLLAGGGFAARVFAGSAMRLFGVFAVFCCGVMFWQFPPGRVDHHSVQITLLLFAVATLARAFDPAQARWAALSGACVAVSLGIGLENLPFFTALAAAPGLAFLLRGAEARGLLRRFGGGLALALIAVFLLTVGAQRWRVPACDALSISWMTPALIGAAAYFLLSFAGNFSRAGRAVLLVLAGAAALAPVVALWPDCLRPPYADVDPVLKTFWMDHIGENQTLAQNYVIAPGAAVLMAVPTLIGLACALFGVVVGRGVARARWLVLAVLLALGFVAACACLRIFSSLAPLAAVGLLAPVDAVRRALAPRGKLLAGVAASVALLAGSSFGVALAMPELEPAPEAKASPDLAWRRPDPCIDSASYRYLDDHKPGLVAGPISPGSYILAHSAMRALAAPYHRNNAGNLAALNILRAAPPQAEILARKAGVDYVLLCWATPADAAALRALSPDGLAARVEDGEIPGWLREVSPEGAPARLYQVLPPSD